MLAVVSGGEAGFRIESEKKNGSIAPLRE